VTRNRSTWLLKAIEHFRLQTHVNRELLIVADGDSVRDLIPESTQIRLIEVASPIEIGAKRNFGCERAAGEVIAHWDDDDYSAPGRLADQMERLASSGKAVTGYRTMRFTDGADWWLYEGSPLYALGTSLCYRKDWWRKHPFPARNIGEDNEFVTAAAVRGELAVSEAGDLMHATIHPGNTSVRQLSGASWKRLSCCA
jgi:glycosyltransferase involved in cell wall biosynthesis